MTSLEDLKKALDAMVGYLVINYPLEVPKWRADGTEVGTPDDLVHMLHIPRSEAMAWLGFKNVYMGLGSGIPPVRPSRSELVQRAHRLTLKPLKKRRKKRKK